MRRSNLLKLHAPVFAALLIVTGCDTGEESVSGVGSGVFSETTLLENTPLTTPPEHWLRPGMETSENDATSRTASELETLEVTDLDVSASEEVLLRQAGSTPAQSDIRAVLFEDNARFVGEWELVEAMMFGDHPTTVVIPLPSGEQSEVAIEDQLQEEKSWFEEVFD